MHAMPPNKAYKSHEAEAAAFENGHLVDRRGFSARDVLHDLWRSLDLPLETLPECDLPGRDGPAVASSFKIGVLAQGCIALSACTASLVHTTRDTKATTKRPPRVTVPLDHAVAEFHSEKLYTLNNHPPASAWGATGGLHATKDGHVRIHDAFGNHVKAILDVLGLPEGAGWEEVEERTRTWEGEELEMKGAEGGAAVFKLRGYGEWDAGGMDEASDGPISLRRCESSSPPKSFPVANEKSNGSTDNATPSKALATLRVLEITRVIAAPLSAKTLAAHGADVLWVTSPNLPDLPPVDRDLSRGKRSMQLDISIQRDKEQLLELARTCDVFIQGYRPGSLAGKGLSFEEVVKVNPGVVYANLSAFGDGLWRVRRGFDSLVQTCSGMNVSEAEHAGKDEPARPTPCQALDHAAGYLLASGIAAALYKRSIQGGAWEVNVSLSGAMKYLRSLGQYPGSTGFVGSELKWGGDVPDEYFEVRDTGFGEMRAVRHSACLEGLGVGWDVMPGVLGSGVAEWK